MSKKSKKGPKHIILPDPHSHPSYGNQRFTALGNLIVEEKPDVVVCVGDFSDMPSLSDYDKGKLSYEGRAYQLDVDAAIDAQEKLFAPLKAYNRGRPERKKYHPRLVMCYGNHEWRIVREVNNFPGLVGKLKLEDLKYADYGWECYPFLQPVTVDTITYCHYFVSGVAGRPISGENIGKSLCNKLHASGVAGHSHVFDHSERAIISGLKIFGMSCGCYTHSEYIEDWNRATVAMWWRGIVILDDIDGAGYYDDLRAITQRKILREYL